MELARSRAANLCFSPSPCPPPTAPRRCPGQRSSRLENWAMVGYCKLNTAEYWKDRNNYNCWGGRSCTAPSTKRTTAVQKIYRDTPHPPPAKANRGDLHLSEGWILVPAEIWAIECIYFFCPFINKQYFLMTELPPLPRKCYFTFFSF